MNANGRTLGAPPRVDLSRLFNPSSIAIIGASSDPKSISGQPLRFLLERGYRGNVYAVNPKHPEVQGVRTYPSALALPGPCDLGVIAVSAIQVPRAIEECGKAGIPFAVVLAGGFAEAGARGAAVQRLLDAAVAKSGVRIVGPNCVGIVNMAAGVFCAFGGALSDPSLRPGPLAIVSQSGGVGQAMMAFANARGIGANYIVSCGNEADIDFFDFAHHLLDQPDVKMVAAYLEASTEGVRLRELGRRALEVGKPILMLKVGNAGAGRRAAALHTGRPTADYMLFQATFKEGGYIEVNDLDELADVAKLVLGGKLPKGRNIAVLTGSGGWGVMLAEQCEKNGLHLPPPSAATQELMAGVGNTFASLSNPVDMMANYDEQHKAMEILLADPVFDQFLIRSPAGPALPAWAAHFTEIAAQTDKPVIVNWASIPGRDADVREKLEETGVLCSTFASRAARAAGVFTDFALKHLQFRQYDPAGTARPVPPQKLELAPNEKTLSEHASKLCLASYGIPTTAQTLVTLDDVLEMTECPIPFPVAVKLVSPDITNKSAADAVRLRIRTLDELKGAAGAVALGGLRNSPLARIDGISIQEMATGLEVIIGAVSDRNFGPYVLVGIGGICAEVLGDLAYRFAPLTARDARDMLRELKAVDIFNGYRGSPPADVDALVRALVNLSWLIADHGDRIAEIDINPLFVRAAGQGAVAADALIKIAGSPATASPHGRG